MSLSTWIAARRLGLGRARTHRIGVQKGLEIPGDTPVLADRYFPRGHGKVPLVVSYETGSHEATRGLMARLLAERGYQVLLVYAPDDVDAVVTDWLQRYLRFPGVVTRVSMTQLLCQV